jgi:hypothetical protein
MMANDQPAASTQPARNLAAALTYRSPRGAPWLLLLSYLTNAPNAALQSLQTVPNLLFLRRTGVDANV